MQDISLDWYREHPYVEVWRTQNQNSYLPTVQVLNSKLNIDVNYPVTLSKVDGVISLYLEKLVSHVREVRKEEPVSTSKTSLSRRFGLNSVEVNYILKTIKI
jgi:hypothetical protein